MADGTANPDSKYNRPTKYTPTLIESGQIPEGARLMSKYEVLDMQMSSLKNHKPQSDIWPFRFGGSIVALGSAMAGMFINSHFRYKFILRNHAVFRSYMPIVILPMLCSAGIQIYIKHCVMLKSHCPTCICVRAGVLQALSSTVYSACIAAPVCIHISKSYHTYVLTKNNFQPNVFHALKTKPFAWNCFLGLAIFNFGLGYLTAHLQGNALEKVEAKYHGHIEPNIAWK